jgi:hypothetical protein
MIGDSHSTGAVGDVVGAGNDVLRGESGLDLLVGDSEGRNASGSGGNDFLDLGADGGFFAVGDHGTFGNATGAGNDVIVGGSAGEALVGDNSPGFGQAATGAGNDKIVGNGGDDILFGDSSADIATTLGPDGGNDFLDGGEGVDALLAGPANDSLDGGPGSPDFCDGEAGVDTATHCEAVAGIP